jgi:hypothetical protein
MVSAPRKRIVSHETRQAMAPTKPGTWRQMGWIFRDGEIIAIEPCGHQTRMRESLGLTVAPNRGD